MKYKLFNSFIFIMLLALLLVAAGCDRQPVQMPIFTYAPPQTSVTPGPSPVPATLTGWQVDEQLLFSAPGLPNNQLFDISPDGKKMAYVAAHGGQETLVLNGVESQAYDRIARDEWEVAAIFSPDSRFGLLSRGNGWWSATVLRASPIRMWLFRSFHPIVCAWFLRPIAAATKGMQAINNSW
jgi:hypothetical protein